MPAYFYKYNYCISIRIGLADNRLSFVGKIRLAFSAEFIYDMARDLFHNIFRSALDISGKEKRTVYKPLPHWERGLKTPIPW